MLLLVSYSLSVIGVCVCALTFISGAGRSEDADVCYTELRKFSPNLRRLHRENPTEKNPDS